MKVTAFVAGLLILVHSSRGGSDLCDGHWVSGNGVPGIVALRDYFQTRNLTHVWNSPEFGELLVVAGRFDVAGGVAVNNIAAFDGANWRPLGEGIECADGRSPKIHAMTTFENDLIVAGDFDQAGGKPAANVARWDGFEWVPLGLIQSVEVLAVHAHDGDLYAGALAFTNPNGNVRAIARWAGSEWQALTAPQASALFGRANSIASVGNDLVFAGDCRLVPPGAPPSERFQGVLRFDGTSISGIGPQLIGRVNDFTESTHGLVVVGDGFSSLGTPDPTSVRLNDGAWVPFSVPGMSRLQSVAEYDGEVYVSGVIEIDDVADPIIGLARWNGATWRSVGALGALSNQDPFRISDLGLTRYRAELIASGYHTSADSFFVAGLSKWDGIEWTPLDSGLLGNTQDFDQLDSPPQIFSVARVNGDLFAGGLFFTTTGVGGLAIQAPDKTWTTFAADVVRSADAIGSLDGNLVVFGGFADPFADQIALLWDGNEWSALGSKPNSDFMARRGIVANNTLYAVGSIAPGVLVLDRANGLWQPLGGGVDDTPELGEFVADIVEFGDSIVIGGKFFSVNGQPLQHLAAWDGQSWSSPREFAERVTALGSQDGKLVVSSDMLSILENGQWTDYPTGAIGAIGAIEFDGEDLLVGGNTMLLDGGVGNGVARLRQGIWERLGTLGRFFDSIPGTGLIYDILAEDSRMYVVGRITDVDGKISVGVAEYACELLLGDMNCDGAITAGDIAGFVAAVARPDVYGQLFPDCDIMNADVNADGAVTISDIGPFVQLLLLP